MFTLIRRMGVLGKSVNRFLSNRKTFARSRTGVLKSCCGALCSPIRLCITISDGVISYRPCFFVCRQSRLQVMFCPDTRHALGVTALPPRSLLRRCSARSLTFCKATRTDHSLSTAIFFGFHTSPPCSSRSCPGGRDVL